MSNRYKEELAFRLISIALWLFACFVSYNRGENNARIDAFQHGVAVPETINQGKWNESIKYRWVEPHLLEEIPPPLPEEGDNMEPEDGNILFPPPKQQETVKDLS